MPFSCPEMSRTLPHHPIRLMMCYLKKILQTHRCQGFSFPEGSKTLPHHPTDGPRGSKIQQKALIFSKGNGKGERVLQKNLLFQAQIPRKNKTEHQQKKKAKAKSTLTHKGHVQRGYLTANHRLAAMRTAIEGEQKTMNTGRRGRAGLTIALCIHFPDIYS